MPFGRSCEWSSFAQCVEGMTDQVDNPNGYCAALMRATEAGCRRRALAGRWRKAIQPLTAARVNSVARKLEPKLKRRFLAAVATMKGNVDLEALAESLRIQSAVEAKIGRAHV